MPFSGFPGVPEYMAREDEHRRQIARVLNSTRQGKVNATLDITLRVNQITTTVTDARVGYTSWLGFMGLTEAGAGAIGRGIWVTALKSGSCVLNHQASAETDQDIRLLIMG